MEDMLQSPLAPQPKPKTNTRQWRDRIRAEAWPEAISHGFHSVIPIECGYCVTAFCPDEPTGRANAHPATSAIALAQ